MAEATRNRESHPHSVEHLRFDCDVRCPIGDGIAARVYGYQLTCYSEGRTAARLQLKHLNFNHLKETEMMQDWNSFRDALLGRVGEYAKLSPDVIRGLQVMDGSAAKTGLLGPKIHELIALAVAVTTRCDGCIAVHTKEAMLHGATKDEIAEALGVAIALNAGAAVTYSARVLDAYAALAVPTPI